MTEDNIIWGLAIFLLLVFVGFIISCRRDAAKGMRGPSAREVAPFLIGAAMITKHLQDETEKLWKRDEE